MALTKATHAHFYLSDFTGKTDYLAKNLTANTGDLKYKTKTNKKKPHRISCRSREPKTPR